MGNPTNSETTYRSKTFNIIKWSLVELIVLNMLSSIWVVIYVINNIQGIKEESDGRRTDPNSSKFQNIKKSPEIWKQIIIAVLVTNYLMCALSIFGVSKEYFCISFGFGIIELIYSIFAFGNNYTRSCTSSYLIPFFTGITAFVFGRRIRVEINDYHNF
jgi:hypothetical protein